MTCLLAFALVALSGFATTRAMAATTMCSCVSGRPAAPLDDMLRAAAAYADSTETESRQLLLDVTPVASDYRPFPTATESFLSDTPRQWRYEFRVHRAWSPSAGAAVPRQFRKDYEVPLVCIKPVWRVGQRYLVRAAFQGDSLITGDDCLGTTYPDSAAESKRAIRYVQSRWRRR